MSHPLMASHLPQLASDQVLTLAYRRLCAARVHAHHDDDVWHVRSVAWQTMEQCREQVSGFMSTVRRWERWGTAGLGGVVVEMARVSRCMGLGGAVPPSPLMHE